MAVYKLSGTSVKNGRTEYSSFLAGNPAYTVPTYYESIATVTVGSGGSANVEFTSIPATYTHLQIRGIARTDRNNGDDDVLALQINSDTASNYSFDYLYGGGAAAGAYSIANQSLIEIISAVPATASRSSNIFATSVLDILDYANTNKYKTTKTFYGFDANGAGLTGLSSGNWRNTNAITSIKLYPRYGTNFVQYSQFALYGIKGA